MESDDSARSRVDSSHEQDDISRAVRSVSDVARQKPRALRYVIESLARPLLSNLFLDLATPKYRTVKNSSKRLQDASSAIGADHVKDLMLCIGFERATCNDEATVWVCTLKSADDWRAANHRLSHIETLLVEDDDNESLELRSKASLVEQQRALARQHVLEQCARDAEERRKHQDDAVADEEARRRDMAADVAAASHLVDACRKVIHATGRLRNASFEGKHFQVRRMTHGRTFACHCPCDCLEAHWHVVNANILYAYVVHLAPDASAVRHTGFEHSYQYNSIPGTEYFGKMLWVSTKHVDETTGALDVLQHHHKPVDACVYCGVPFRLLLL